MSKSWIDDGLKNKQETETRIKEFYSTFFKKYPELKSYADKLMLYREKLSELYFKISFSEYKNDGKFVWIFNNKIDTSTDVKRRTLELTFREENNYPIISANYEDEYTEYSDDTKRDIKTDSDFNIIPKLNDSYIENVLGWLCFKNNFYTKTVYSKQEFSTVSFEKFLPFIGLAIGITMFIVGKNMSENSRDNGFRFLGGTAIMILGILAAIGSFRSFFTDKS